MNKKKITAIFWFDFVTKISEIIENRNSKLVIFENKIFSKSAKSKSGTLGKFTCESNHRLKDKIT
jgi:hypothetical protein